MKRKVGELNNIPIVEGDPNLLKSNEILHKGGGQLSKRDNTGEIKDLGSGDGGSASNDEVKERWVSVYNSADTGGPVDFKEFNIYFKSELGYRILNELCDVFIGWAAIPYTSGNGYSISGGTMNIGELNNLRKGVDSEGRADKQFMVRAFKFREINDSNKFIDIVDGNSQQPYKGGLGNLDTLSLYPILLNHNFWNNKNREERLLLTITIYSILVSMKQIDEDTLLKDLYDNNITIEDLFIQNDVTEEFINMFSLMYVNKEEELNKVIEYITNYNGFNN